MVGRPGERQAGAVLLPFGIPGDDRDRPERGVDPGNEAQAPIAGIEPNDAWAYAIEGHGLGQEQLGNGRVMAAGGGKEEEQRLPRASASSPQASAKAGQATSQSRRS